MWEVNGNLIGQFKISNMSGLKELGSENTDSSSSNRSFNDSPCEGTAHLQNSKATGRPTWVAVRIVPYLQSILECFVFHHVGEGRN